MIVVFIVVAIIAISMVFGITGAQEIDDDDQGF